MRFHTYTPLLRFSCTLFDLIDFSFGYRTSAYFGVTHSVALGMAQVSPEFDLEFDIEFDQFDHSTCVIRKTFKLSAISLLSTLPLSRNTVQEELTSDNINIKIFPTDLFPNSP